MSLARKEQLWVLLSTMQGMLPGTTKPVPKGFVGKETNEIDLRASEILMFEETRERDFMAHLRMVPMTWVGEDTKIPWSVCL